jgi:predicted metal-binding protein
MNDAWTLAGMTRSNSDASVLHFTSCPLLYVYACVHVARDELDKQEVAYQLIVNMLLVSCSHTCVYMTL